MSNLLPNQARIIAEYAVRARQHARSDAPPASEVEAVNAALLGGTLSLGESGLPATPRRPARPVAQIDGVEALIEEEIKALTTRALLLERQIDHCENERGLVAAKLEVLQRLVEERRNAAQG